MANQTENQTDKSGRSDEAGTPDEALRAAEGMSAGPEANTHPNKAYDAREETGRRATDDWKKNQKP